MSTKKGLSGMRAGRPSETPESKERLRAQLEDVEPPEPNVRVNFELSQSKHTKLKIQVARSGQKSIKEFLTAYIDSLPDE